MTLPDALHCREQQSGRRGNGDDDQQFNQSETPLHVLSDFHDLLLSQLLEAVYMPIVNLRIVRAC
jgi:hypothetical protein